MVRQLLQRHIARCVLAALCLFAGQAWAAVYYADAGRPDDSGNGLSWAAAKKTLQAAIDAASTAGGGEVWVKAGTYNETRSNTNGDGALVMKSNVQLYGGFAGAETLRDQRDPAARLTTISGVKTRGGLYWAYVTIRMESTINCTIDGFTITGASSGSITGPMPKYNGGGGIYGIGLDETNRIANCVVTKNQMGFLNYGGGMYFENSGPVISHCSITTNYNMSGYGAGVYCDNTTISRTIKLNDCTISGGMATEGAGLYARNAAVELTSCTFANNQAGPRGGAVLLSGAVPATFDRCTFSGNSCNYFGGAVTLLYASTTFTNCVFTNNTTQDYGGALFIWSASSDQASKIVNCTMAGNSAPNGGGAIYVTAAPSLLIQNTIFSGNTAQAIYEGDLGSDPIIRNCLFFNNSNGDYLDEKDPSTGKNGSVKTGAAAINALVNSTGSANSGNVTGDPKLESVYRLGAGSAAIDRGDPTEAPATDIDGALRPMDIVGVGADGAGAFDIGAHEFGALLPPVFTAHPVSQALTVSDALTLRVAVTGSAPLTYQWLKDGAPLAGQTSSTLRLASVALADAGDYACRVTNGAGFVDSHAARVTVEPPPGALSDSAPTLAFPKDTRWAVDVEKGGTPTLRTFTLTNTGGKPVAFTGGGAATPGLALSGANAADFSIAQVSPATSAPLAPGAALTVTIRFAPTQSRRTLGLSATLTVTTDSPLTPTLAIPLQGDAVPVTLSGFNAE